VSQCAKIYGKIFKDNWHEYTLPSGKNIKLQGYEPYAMDILLRQYNENDILYKRTDMPELWYHITEDEQHRYYPDFYIPKDNLIIEVKSEYFYNLHLKINILKEECVIESDYNFKLMMLEKDKLISFD